MIIVGLAPEQKLSALEQKHSHSRKKDAREAQHREVCRRRTPWSHCSCISLSVDSDGLGTVQWRSTGASCRPGSSPPQRPSRLVRTEHAHDPEPCTRLGHGGLHHRTRATHTTTPPPLHSTRSRRSKPPARDPVQNAPRLARDTSTPRTHRRAHSATQTHSRAHAREPPILATPTHTQTR